MKGHEFKFEKEITVFYNGQHYIKSKIQIKGHFKGETAITFTTKYKDGKLSQEGEYSVGGLSTDFLDENVNLKRKVAIKDYSVTSEFSLADKISSSYSKLAPNLSIGFGYKNHSVEVGTKSEDGYRVTYVKEHNQVKQDYATVKTTNETGVRTVDHLTQTFNTTGEVVSGAFNWVVEHPKEVAMALGAVAVVALGVVAAPVIGTALGTLLATVSSVKLLGGAVTSILIGISIFNDKGE